MTSETPKIFHPSARDNPFPLYRALREEAPAVFDIEHDTWLISRYEDVASAIKDVDSFSSSPASFEQLLLGGDPPGHTRVRRIVGRALPRASALETRIRELVSELIEPLKGRTACDIIDEFATPLPLRLIVGLLTLDPDDYGTYKLWSDTIVEAEEALAAGGPERGRTLDLIAQCDTFFEAHVRTADIAGGFVGKMLAGDDEESRLTVAEAAVLAKLTLVAGNETTVNLIGNAALHLAENPDVQDKLRRRPELIQSFVEESLRYDSPVQVTQRRTTRAVSVNDVEIPADARVMLLLGSANRDPHRFAEADRFDLDRDTRGHLAFGTGAHACLGAPLARLEARIAIQALLEELPPFALAAPGMPLNYRHSYQIRGLTSLDLAFRNDI